MAKKIIIYYEKNRNCYGENIAYISEIKGIHTVVSHDDAINKIRAAISKEVCSQDYRVINTKFLADFALVIHEIDNIK